MITSDYMPSMMAAMITLICMITRIRIISSISMITQITLIPKIVMITMIARISTIVMITMVSMITSDYTGAPRGQFDSRSDFHSQHTPSPDRLLPLPPQTPLPPPQCQSPKTFPPPPHHHQNLGNQSCLHLVQGPGRDPQDQAA